MKKGRRHRGNAGHEPVEPEAASPAGSFGVPAGGRVRGLLAELGLHPSKALGQNFLHDPNMARWIVSQADLRGISQWVEVGPGLGALTPHLLATRLPGVAVEKDNRLASFLVERFGAEGIEVVNADATRWDLRPRFAHGPALCIGNLPYRVTTPLLFHFLGEASPAEQAIIMVQREVALRLAAAPATSDYGSLTLAIGRRWKVEYLRTVPPQLFFPAPQVESAVLRLRRRSPAELPPCSGAWFERVVRAGFSQRRKQLRKLVAEWVPDWPSTARPLGVREDARAEDLDLARWVELARIAAGDIGRSAQDPGGEVFDVVDDRDQVTGQATRREVHVNNLRHRAVHVLMFNHFGEIFLQKRSPWKDRHPGVWDSSASGHLDAGEDYPACALREVCEELGVALAEVPVELARIEASEATGMEFVRVYAARHEGPFDLPPSEIETGLFFAVQVVREWIGRRPQDFAPGFLACFERWEAARR